MMTLLARRESCLHYCTARHDGNAQGGGREGLEPAIFPFDAETMSAFPEAATPTMPWETALGIFLGATCGAALAQLLIFMLLRPVVSKTRNLVDDDLIAYLSVPIASCRPRTLCTHNQMSLTRRFSLSVYMLDDGLAFSCARPLPPSSPFRCLLRSCPGPCRT